MSEEEDELDILSMSDEEIAEQLLENHRKRMNRTLRLIEDRNYQNDVATCNECESPIIVTRPDDPSTSADVVTFECKCDEDGSGHSGVSKPDSWGFQFL